MILTAKNPVLLMGLAFALLLALIAAPAPPARAAEADVAMFYDALSSYGNWVNYGNYGPVWYPTQGVTQNWRPYVDGRWVPTDEGWVFETSEPWGWATYHWGNWMPTTEYGWVWAPGSTWYPSTAAWRTSPEDAPVDTSYVGWAPIPPPDYVPEPAYYPEGGYYPGMPPLDLLSAPFWTFAQAASFLLGFGQPFVPAYSYYNCGCLSPYSYAPVAFANTLFLNNCYYPRYNHRAFFYYGPPFQHVARVTNININNINGFARNVNINHLRNGLPPNAVINRHPFFRDAVPAAVRGGQRFQVQRVANPASVARHVANPRVTPPPANVPRPSQEIPKGVTPAAQPAVRGGARGVTVAPRGPTAPKEVTTPRGAVAPRGEVTPRGGVAPGAHHAPEVVTTPGREHAAPSRAPAREMTPSRAPTGQFTAPGRERPAARTPSREFRAPSRGTTMPPPSTHELSPRMQQQIRQYHAPSRPAPQQFRAPTPSFQRSAPAMRAPRMAPSAPAPRPSAPAPTPHPSAPAPAPHGGVGGGFQHR